MPKVLARKMCTENYYIWYSSDYSTCVEPSSAFLVQNVKDLIILQSVAVTTLRGGLFSK